MIRGVAVALIAGWPQAALACAVCSGNDQGASAFLASTIFLSLFPLGLIGGGVAWIAWRARALNRPLER